MPELQQQPASSKKLGIRTKALEMVYGEGTGRVHALRGLDLDIPAGQFVCVMGPSGCGKSTLLHLLSGLKRPTSGEIHVGDAAVHKLSLDEAARWRRRNVGLVHQFFNLLPSLNIVQNIAVPLLLEGWRVYQLHDQIDALLERLSLSHRRNHSLADLSGGEMQRVAIARALLPKPGTLLADEPTGNLDSAQGHDVLALFRELCIERRMTTVLMTHDLEATSYADRVVGLRDGHIESDSESSMASR